MLPLHHAELLPRRAGRPPRLQPHRPRLVRRDQNLARGPEGVRGRGPCHSVGREQGGEWVRLGGFEDARCSSARLKAGSGVWQTAVRTSSSPIQTHRQHRPRTAHHPQQQHHSHPHSTHPSPLALSPTPKRSRLPRPKVSQATLKPRPGQATTSPQPSTRSHARVSTSFVVTC